MLPVNAVFWVPPPIYAPAPVRPAAASSQTHQKAPPQYEPSKEIKLQLFNRIQAAVQAERNSDIDACDSEVERMRKFLIYCLAVDYQFPGNFALLGPDREHFLQMATLLNDIAHFHQRTHLTEDERKQLAPYFWKYLHEPCQGLSIPVESAAIIVVRFASVQSLWGRYKGTVQNTLNRGGIPKLAKTLYMDKHVLIPRLTSSAATRKTYLQQLERCARKYFVSFKNLDSVAWGDEFAVPWQSGGWHHRSNLDYDLTARGRAYNATQAGRNGAMQRSKIIGFRFLIQDAVSAIKSAKARRASMSWGKAVSGDLVYPKSRPDPDGWVFYGSMHLPDFLEFRPDKSRCDL